LNPRKGVFTGSYSPSWKNPLF